MPADDPDILKTRHHYHYFVEFPGSFALLAPFDSVDNAVIFVHGFGGDACETWAHFQLLIDDLVAVSPGYANADLFFFQYHSLAERIVSSVNRLLQFFDALIPEPNLEHFMVAFDPVLIDPEQSNVRSVLLGPRHYRRVVLVGHSEGAVVIRKAILERAEGASSLLQSRLRLFAPALFGYQPSGLLGTIAKFPGMGSVIDAILWGFPAYQDLRDTKDLSDLQSQTEALEGHLGSSGFRAHILWARKDHIVKQDKYKEDKDDFEEGHNHVSICKPNKDYPKPLFLIAADIIPKEDEV